MRWVPQAAISPHRCAVIPFVGNSNAKAGFFDTGQDLPGWDPHVYVSVEAVEQMASQIGWEPAGKRAVAERRIVERDAVIAELKAQIAEHEEFEEAAKYTLSRFDTKVRAKPGRKPEKAAS